MRGMLRSISGYHFVVARVALQGEGRLEDVVAGLHEHEDSLDLLFALLDALARPFSDIFDELVLDDLTGPVEEVLHHVEELGVFCGRYILQFVRDLVIGVATILDSQKRGRLGDFRRLLKRA